ncbi:MAG: hypothetical protein JXA30_08460 [Deltaproteobacteria bacterium]|nr:hypothetical protein [Deltaproteobacteria bacterium]
MSRRSEYDSSDAREEPERPAECVDGSCDAEASSDSSNGPEYDSRAVREEPDRPTECADGSCDTGVSQSSLSCDSDIDCERFGSAYCFEGACKSFGLDCATIAGIDGAEASPGGGTVAAAFDEWRHVAYGIVSFVCAYQERCLGPQTEPMCHEVGLNAADDTCCKATLEFFAEHRRELVACAEPRELPCGIDFSQLCPVLSEQSFEDLCE